MYISFALGLIANVKERKCLRWNIGFTTRPPAVMDVFDSGRNDGALRPGRRVAFRSLPPGGQTTFCGAPIIFVTPIALEL